MSRLLFAAARGARLQRQHEAMPPSRRVWWEDVRIQWGLDDELRIHPDDEHLQYGPISSVYRKAAVEPDGSMKKALTTHGIFDVCLSDWLGYGKCGDELHRSLYLLILAEALADEGL